MLVPETAIYWDTFTPRAIGMSRERNNAEYPHDVEFRS